jgi:hypothetical protein
MATQVVSGMGQIQIRDNINNVLYGGGFASVEISTKVEINKANIDKALEVLGFNPEMLEGENPFIDKIFTNE